MKLYLLAKNNLVYKKIWLFMALYFINGIIDAPNVLTNHSSISHNEQETIIEFVLEKVLNYGDVIPENQDNESQEQSAVKKLKLEVYFLELKSVFLQPLYNYNAKMFCYKAFFVYDSFLLKFSPPPEMIA